MRVTTFISQRSTLTQHINDGRLPAGPLPLAGLLGATEGTP
jgi:hypothetical protein